MRKFFALACAILSFATNVLIGADGSFKVVVLGAHGGPRENNLSSYLLAPTGGNVFVSLDAGSLLHGIYEAYEKGSFQDIEVSTDGKFNVEADILRNHIKAYLISHAHLDHIAGLVINSPKDASKPIFGIDPTIDFLRDYVFNWKIWPNFGSEGEKPLNQYQYQRMRVGERIQIPNTEMSVEPFILNHPGDYASTAFLIQSGSAYVLYMGDTSPDALESKKQIEMIWRRMIPLIRLNLLKGIFIECSFTDEQDSETLVGHLNPRYLMDELSQLAEFVDPLHPSLMNCKVIVTHIKEALENGASSQEIIEAELSELNSLGIEFIFPEQGGRFEL